MHKPIRVLVTGAAGKIGYTMLYVLARGNVFGLDRPIILHLLELASLKNELAAIAIELEDCMMPLLLAVISTADPAVAFKHIDCAFLAGSKPLKHGMKSKDLLATNVKIFKEQGKALNQYAHKHVKVLVLGNPGNTNAYICTHYPPSISGKNFSALSRLDQNRATAAIAAKLRVPAGAIDNITVWGNHSVSLYPDVSNATVTIGNELKCLLDAINDVVYLQGPFIEHVLTETGQMVSMAVISDGSYNIPNDIIFSFPVECSVKEWKIVQRLPLNDFAKNKLLITAKELVDERNKGILICGA